MAKLQELRINQGLSQRKLAERAGLSPGAVWRLEHQGSGRNMQRMQLQQIADVTGGQAFFPGALKDLDAAYEKVLAEIKAQYQLGYGSTNTAQDGAWRKVEIKVRTRKGYFAPYKEGG